MFRSFSWRIAVVAPLLVLMGGPPLPAQTPPATTENAHRAATVPSSPFRRASERSKAENLLKRARAAATDGNFELAMWYVDAADKLQVNYESMFHRFTDTPAKARADIQRMRSTTALPQPSAVASQPGSPPRPSSVPHASMESAPTQSLPSAPNESQVVPATPQDATPAHVEVAAYSEPAPSTPAYYMNELVAPDEGRQQPTVSIVDPASGAPRQLVDPNRARSTQPNQRSDGAGVATSDLIARGTQLHDARGTNAPHGSTPTWPVLRERSLGWLAEAKAALDRGDIDLADRYARAAQDLRVPDSEYRHGDPRPWMLLMEIAQRQRRVDPTLAGAYPHAAQVGSAPPGNEQRQVDSVPATLAGGFDPLTTLVGDPPMSPSHYGVTPAAAHQPVAAPGAQPSQPLPGIENPFVPPAGQMVPAGAVANAQYNGAGQLDRPTGQAPGPLPPAAIMQRSDGSMGLYDSELPYAPTTSSPVGDPRTAGAGASNPAMMASTDPTIPSTAPAPQALSDGMRHFREGRKALESHQLELAQEMFQKAWQQRQELDAATVQQLQDHLQVLRATATSELTETPVRSLLEPESELSTGAAKSLVTLVAREQASIRGMKESDPIGAWERLKRLNDTINEAAVDETVRAQLRSRVASDSRELEAFITHNRVRLETDARNKEILAEIERSRQQRIRNEGMLADLTEQFNELMDQQRFSEAIVVAKKARELAPEEPVVQTMIEKSRVARQVVTSMLRNEKYQGAALAALNDVDSAGIPIEGNIEFPEARYWEDITSTRKKQLAAQQRRYTEEELAIREALKRKIEVQFDQEPLSSVLDHIAQETGINVFLDPEGLTAEGLTSNALVSLTLPRPISLRSALNLMLEPLHLSYVIDNEVLRITTEQVKQAKSERRSYKVADLIIKIPNFVPNNDMGLPGALREAHNVASKSLQVANATNQPLTIIADDPSLKPPVGNASVLAQMQTANVYPGQPAPTAVASTDSSLGGGALVDFDTLIQLITTTVEPDSWEDNGGAGTIAGFPTNLSLVVSNTQEVHEKIVDLLEQLRQLQDLQITIEVRFITLNDSFFERIGVDFDFNIDDNTGLSIVDLQNLDDVGPSITVGLDPTGVITPDLDIQFTQGSFGATAPTFGGFVPGVGANVGFAILSDIEAFFLIEAAQGDTRTNVLQAPKVTLYDGQTASVSDVSQRPFVTSVIPVVADFAVGHQPVITVLTEGTTLSVQAVVSNDRRFVRLTLVPFFSSIGNVDTFTFIGRTDTDSGTNATDPTDDTAPDDRNNVRRLTEGTTVQLPTLAFTSVSTTVSVPDGGTILLGGIKRLSEGRNERGVPMLSKIPYVDRLFRNVGIGRDTQSLMMMVTPRIIIQEEEEQKLGLGL